MLPDEPLLPGLGRAMQDAEQIADALHSARSGEVAWARHIARKHFPQILATLASGDLGGPAQEDLRYVASLAIEGTSLGELPTDGESSDLREALLKALRASDHTVASSIAVQAAGSAHPLLQAEGLAVQAYLSRVEGDSVASSAFFLDGARVALSGGHRWHAARLLLLADETSGGETDSWAAAVETEARLAYLGLVDPLFWSRAMDSRGTRTWPSEAISACLAISGLPDLTDPDTGYFSGDGDAIIGFFVATEAHDRGDGARALLTFRRTEAVSRTKRMQGFCVVGQGRALILLGRVSHARSVLTSAAESRDDAVRCFALAQIGAIELSEERPERAATVLQEALELAGHAVRFPARTDAIANLGLALLSSSRFEQGLTRLRQAARGYRDDHDLEGVLLTLRNEQEYARATGNASEVERLREQLREVMSDR